MKEKKIKHPILTAACCVALVLASAGTIAMRTAENTSAINPVVFDVSTKIYKDNQLIASPQIISLDHQHATIVISSKTNHESLKYDVIATSAANSNILIAYAIDFKDGDLYIRSDNSYLLFAPGEEKTIPIYTDASHKYEMKMQASVQAHK